MIILDTNVVSELMRPRPARSVVEWIVSQDSQSLYLSAVSEAELRYGVEILPAGQRREGLRAAMEAMFREDFAGRILPFDSPSTQAYATIAACRRVSGRPINHEDCQIAAIASTRSASVATRDASGFEGCGVEVINPWIHG
ncbi:MAG: type II toxin-antitoxin system VapC family toxin [Dehalococcoidia bacterium]|nr:type II toxin-antitoxin system VapC family toxin [Dehalococcoidia bacterium]